MDDGRALAVQAQHAAHNVHGKLHALGQVQREACVCGVDGTGSRGQPGSKTTGRSGSAGARGQGIGEAAAVKQGATGKGGAGSWSCQVPFQA